MFATGVFATGCYIWGRLVFFNLKKLPKFSSPPENLSRRTGAATGLVLEDY